MSLRAPIYLAGSGIYDPVVRLLASHLVSSTPHSLHSENTDIKFLFSNMKHMSKFTSTGSKIEYSNVVSPKNGWKKTVELEYESLNNFSAPRNETIKDLVLPTLSYTGIREDLRAFESVIDENTNLIFVNSTFGVTESCLQQFWKDKNPNKMPNLYEIDCSHILRSSFGFGVNHIREGQLTLSKFSSWNSDSYDNNDNTLPQEEGELKKKTTPLVENDSVPLTFSKIHQVPLLNSIYVSYEDKLKLKLQQFLIESSLYPILALFECTPRDIFKSKSSTDLCNKLLSESLNTIRELPIIQREQIEDPSIREIMNYDFARALLKKTAFKRSVQKYDLKNLLKQGYMTSNNMIYFSALNGKSARTHRTIANMLKFKDQLSGERDFDLEYL